MSMTRTSNGDSTTLLGCAETRQDKDKTRQDKDKDKDKTRQEKNPVFMSPQKQNPGMSESIAVKA